MSAPTSQTVPILTAWPIDKKAYLQSYRSFPSPNLPNSFWTLGQNVLIRASGISPKDPQPEQPTLLLTAWINPVKTRLHQIKVSRPASHRPSPSTYINDIRDAFLRAPITPDAQIKRFFPRTGPPGSIPKAKIKSAVFQNDVWPQACAKALPFAAVSIQAFDPRKAVVWIHSWDGTSSGDAESGAAPAAGTDTSISPDAQQASFKCIGGWARWCGLLQAMEKLQLSTGSESEAASRKQFADMSIPVYILDGNLLKESDIGLLSVWLNLMDTELESPLSGESRKFAVVPPPADGKSAPNVKEEKEAEQAAVESVPKDPPFVVSRPVGLGDRFWSLLLLLTQTYQEGLSVIGTLPIVPTLVSRGFALESHMEFMAWLNIQASLMQKSTWSRISDILFAKFGLECVQHSTVAMKEESPGVAPGIRPWMELILCCLLSWVWPVVEPSRLLGMTFNDLNEEFGNPFGPMPAFHGQTRSMLYFFIDTFTHYLPYQLQTDVQISDLVGVTRMFELFFEPRGKEGHPQLARVPWTRPNDISLLTHFSSKRESATEFLSRVVASEKLKAEGPQVAFDALAGFVSFYNIHLLMELDNFVNHPDSSAAQVLPKALPETPNTIWTPGAARVVGLLRLIMITSVCSYRSPSLLLEYCKSLMPDNVIGKRAPLQIPTVDEDAEPDSPLQSFAEMFLPASVTETGVVTRRDKETIMEATVGALAEFIFRMAVIGCTNEEVFATPPASLQSLSPLIESLIQRQDMTKPHMIKPSLASMTKAASLVVHTLFRASIDGQKEVEAVLPLAADSGFSTIVLTSIVDARGKAYEHLCGFLSRQAVDPATFPHYYFIFRIAASLFRKRPAEAGMRAESMLCGFMPPQSYVQASPPNVPAKGTTPNMISHEGFGRACADRIRNLADRGHQPTMGTHLALGYSGTLANGSAQTRITKWFEDRRLEARELMIHLFDRWRDPNSDASVKMIADFRNRSVEEAREAAGPVSDLAADSTNVASSLAEVPYRFQVKDPSVLYFAKNALDSVIREVEEPVKANLMKGLEALIESKDHDHTVVVSARPIVITVLWQSLTCLSPFFDVLHPLALHWQDLRASFCTWLWAQLRERLNNFWTGLCKSRINDPRFEEDSGLIPQVKYSLRRLNSVSDPVVMHQVPDLVPEKLGHILRGPRSLDRICSAFYRFQCSGMANARAALGAVGGAGSAQPPLTTQDLKTIFTAKVETCLDDLFRPLFEQMQVDLPAEDVLDDPSIASAGFLKRYAPYVLSGLENQELQLEAQTGAAAQVQDPDQGLEPLIKRRRKEPVDTWLRRGGRGDPRYFAKDVQSSSPVDFENLFASLPMSVAARLRQPLPASSVYDQLEQSFHTLRPVEAAGVVNARNQPATQPEENQHATLRKRRKSARQGETVATEQKPIVNGAFPYLPEWLESSPMWDVWHKAVVQDPLETQYVPNTVEDVPEAASGDGAYLHREVYGTIPEPEWELMKAVLHELARRGIDGLYSHAADRSFSLKGMAGETPGSNRSSSLDHLRLFLLGYTAGSRLDTCALDPYASDDAITCSSDQQLRQLSLAIVNQNPFQ